jgi:hypothetical protein
MCVRVYCTGPLLSTFTYKFCRLFQLPLLPIFHAHLSLGRSWHAFCWFISRLLGFKIEFSRSAQIICGLKEREMIMERPRIVNCWDYLNCQAKKACPAFPSRGWECWNVPGTQCRGESQGGYDDKIVQCRGACDFYRDMMMGKIL